MPASPDPRTDDPSDAAGRSRRRSALRARAAPWLTSLLLLLPAALPYVGHALYATYGASPTGFIQIDMPQYMAYAREIFEGGGPPLLYANPFSPDERAPQIYFHLQSLAMGLLWRATGWDPGVVFVVFGLFAALACARVGVALYAEVVGLGGGAQRLGLVGFFWGGGLLALTGAATSLAVRGRVEQIFAFDPFEGWWFLNFGRNLILPTEAYYHALFLGCVLAVIRERYRLALLLVLLVCASHHFTAVELLLTLLAWAALERLIVRAPRPPWAFPLALLGIAAAFFAYTFGVLEAFEEHREVSAQMKLDWTYEARHIVPAYALVAGLALWRMRGPQRVAAVLAEPRNRLFVVWFAVAFALANHELVMRPIQPLHFTRGYVWLPLFLLGAPVLVGGLQALRERAGSALGAAAAGLVVAVFCLDNAAWLGAFPLEHVTGRTHAGVVLAPEQREVLRWLDRPENAGRLLLSEDPAIGYLAPVYTPVRSWQSHRFSTPGYAARGAELKALFRRGRMLPQWEQRRLLILVNSRPGAPSPPAWLARRGAERVLENPAFAVYRLDPKAGG
ncbi:MAG TPA: hypothetical protein VIY27_01265 [Myxococcota bacterium]